MLGAWFAWYAMIESLQRGADPRWIDNLAGSWELNTLLGVLWLIMVFVGSPVLATFAARVAAAPRGHARPWLSVLLGTLGGLITMCVLSWLAVGGPVAHGIAFFPEAPKVPLLLVAWVVRICVVALAAAHPRVAGWSSQPTAPGSDHAPRGGSLP